VGSVAVLLQVKLLPKELPAAEADPQISGLLLSDKSRKPGIQIEKPAFLLVHLVSVPGLSG
jgi:hypothetical protein